METTHFLTTRELIQFLNEAKLIEERVHDFEKEYKNKLKYATENECKVSYAVAEWIEREYL